MSTLFTALKSLKLSLTQYLAAGVALIIGGLVVALRVQGSRLHKAQVSLLQVQFSKTMDLQDAAVEAARAKLNKALDTYHDAGGK